MDWNNDGFVDLIVGEYGVKTGTATGKIKFYERNSDGSLQAPVPLECNGEEITARYTAPEVVDWNNDGLLDLLVGYVDGIDGEKAPYLFINDGTKEQYHFSTKEVLKDETGTKIVDFYYGRIHVKVADLNDDGKKDLLMGGWGGGSPGERFYFYENVGTDAQPVFKSKQELMSDLGSPLVTGGQHWNQRFTFWDWNNDGYEDLIWADYKQSKEGGTQYTNPLYISFSSTNGSVNLVKKGIQTANKPVKTRLQAQELQLLFEEECTINLQLSTLSGRPVYSKSNCICSAGENRVVLPPELSKGVYILTIQGSATSVQKVVLQ